MRTIYYKEAPENPESLKALLKDHFYKNSPATFWSDDDRLQCDAFKNRSIDDLLLLANHYFPESTVKDILNVYKELNAELKDQKKAYLIFTCSTIHKPVLLRSLYDVCSNYSDRTKLIHEGTINFSCHESKFTSKELKELLEE